VAILKQSEPVLYQMKVSLIDIEPPIWRRFLVTGDQTLHRFHLILQSIMGWDDYHLYEFTIDNALYGEPDEDSEPDMKSAHRCRLSEVIHDVGQKMIYLYDFGDYWEHEIVVEKISPAKPDGLYPVCIAGERASPVEDCGGVTGYYDLLGAIGDPEHEEHESMIVWARRDGVDYDPEECNLKGINRELRFYWPKGQKWSYPLAITSVNRYVAIIKPREPFYQWLISISDGYPDITLEEMRRDCLSLLAPELDREEEFLSFIEAVYEYLFEFELGAWHLDKTEWPQDRNFELFRKWFDIEIHSEVIDLLDEEIVKEDF
jgi:hypothetical protein